MEVDKKDILAGVDALQKMLLSRQTSTSTLAMTRLDPPSLTMKDQEI
jgi:hypothetical protein